MMKEMMIYPYPVKEGETVYNPRPLPTGSGSPTELYAKNIDDIIQKKITGLGLDKYTDIEGNPIDYRTTRFLPSDQREILNNALRNDLSVLEYIINIFEENSPKLLEAHAGKEEKLIPELADWNAADKTKMDSAIYDGGTLTVYGLGALHSYVVQKIRDPNVPKGLIDSPSISGIVMSKDEEFPVGYRGGKNLPNTLMTVPAGSVFIPSKDNGVDYIFNSFWEELYTELGQTREDITSAEIEGIVFDDKVGGNSLFVINAQSKLDKDEMTESWEEKSKDRWEHKDFAWVGNTPVEVEEFLFQHDLEYSKNNLPEIPLNEAPLLKPAKLSLMCHGRYLDAEFEYTIQHDM